MMLRNVRKRTNAITLSKHARRLAPYSIVKAGLGKRPRTNGYAIKVAKTERRASIPKINHEEEYREERYFSTPIRDRK
jgi:hypothetical protein